MKKLLLLAAGLCVLAALALCAFYRGLTLRKYVLVSSKISGNGLRLVLLTDLHSTDYGEALIRMVAAQSPDAILLGGDIVDDVRPREIALSCVEALTRIAPCYYVPGSHDMVRPDYPEVLDRMTRSGVQPLSGRSVTLTVRGQTVCFAGVDDLDGAYQNDPVRYAGALDRATADLSADSYNILLAHRPDAIELYDRYPLDLVLSGHTHGGQVRIPLLLNGLYAPGQGLFPRYAGGQYLVGDTQMIVSRGLSYYPRLPRIFNPPEVVVVDLQKGEPASW